MHIVNSKHVQEQYRLILCLAKTIDVNCSRYSMFWRKKNTQNIPWINEWMKISWINIESHFKQSTSLQSGHNIQCAAFSFCVYFYSSWWKLTQFTDMAYLPNGNCHQFWINWDDIKATVKHFRIQFYIYICVCVRV